MAHPPADAGASSPSPLAGAADLPAATAAAAAAAAAATAAADGVPSTTVRFPNSAGDTLVATLTVPAGATRAAVLCHGFRDSKAAPLLAAVAAALAARGVASLRPDFRGCGDSGGDWSFGNYADEAADVAAAVDWLRAGGGRAGDSGGGGGGGGGWSVDAVAGHSKGAGSVLLYASSSAFPGLVVNIAGRFHMRDGVRARLGEERWAALWRDGSVEMPGYTVTRAAVEARFGLDMGAAAAGLAPAASLLTLHGDGDATIPVADAAAYGAVVPPPRHRVVVLPGADHKFSEHRAEVAELIADAFAERFG